MTVSQENSVIFGPIRIFTPPPRQSGLLQDYLVNSDCTIHASGTTTLPPGEVITAIHGKCDAGSWKLDGTWSGSAWSISNVPRANTGTSPNTFSVKIFVNISSIPYTASCEFKAVGTCYYYMGETFGAGAAIQESLQAEAAIPRIYRLALAAAPADVAATALGGDVRLTSGDSVYLCYDDLASSATRGVWREADATENAGGWRLRTAWQAGAWRGELAYEPGKNAAGVKPVLLSGAAWDYRRANHFTFGCCGAPGKVVLEVLPA